MKIFFKILKYTLFFMPVMIILTVIIRLVSSGDPAESKFILNTHAFESAYKNLGGDFLLYELSLRNPFASEAGDTFRVLDALYLESSRDLQLTLRGKKNRLENIRRYLKLSGEESYADLLELYLRVTTRIQDEDAVIEIFDISASHLFETDRYEYIRVNFSDININYAKTKVELFVFDSLGDYKFADYKKYPTSDVTFELEAFIPLARITLFDINMPKEKTKVEKHEILK